MSSALLDATLAYLKTRHARPQVADLRAYGGEFNSEEFDHTSYTCPAVLCTVLGWKPEVNNRRLGGKNVRSVRMAAFVVFKHPDREQRMRGASLLAEALCVSLRLWTPVDTAQALIAPLEEEPTAENLYGRAVDKRGQALWLVSWEQCVKPVAALPQLYDLLTVEIDDLVRQGAVPAPTPAPTPAPVPLQVTEQVTFAPLPPN